MGRTALEVKCVVDGWVRQCKVVNVLSGKVGYEVAGNWVLRNRIEGSRKCWEWDGLVGRFLCLLREKHGAEERGECSIRGLLVSTLGRFLGGNVK